MFGVLIGTSALIFFNIVNIILIIRFLLNVEIISMSDPFLLLLSAFIVVPINYLYLGVINKFDQIIEGFENRSEQEDKFGKRITMFYFSFTFVLFIVLEFLKPNR